MAKRGPPVMLMFLAISAAAAFGETGPPLPGPNSKCPVCGMFVAKYTDFLARILFRVGTSEFFDGPKDMFKCYLNVRHYLPGKNKDDVAAVFVTDYYSLKVINARSAVFVIGSDVRGPMGREFVPFGKAAEAGEFRKDHHGTSSVRFEDVTPAMLEEKE